MSDLQLSLIALGAVFVVAVAGYNFLQERRARRRAESAFGSAHPDALLDPVVDGRGTSRLDDGRGTSRLDDGRGTSRLDDGRGTSRLDDGRGTSRSIDRREPVLGELPEEVRQDPSLGSLDEVIAPAPDVEPAPASPSAVIASRIDTIALVLADEPIARAQVEPLLDALQSHATPVHVEGLVDEQWMPVEDSPKDAWRELRAGLQLASRAGPVAEEEVAAFNETVAGFAASINAVSQREGPADAAVRSRELDRFCAETDIEVAVNIVGRSGATFSLARVKALALENGFAETGSGPFERRGPDGFVAMTLRLQFGEPRRETIYATGLTFALDVPHVANPVAVLGDMGAVAEAFSNALGGELVDDDRRPLGATGLAAIRRSLDAVAQRMEAHGIPAGGALARRLFS